MGAYMRLDPTVQSAGPAYINQLKILICSEYEADRRRPHLYTKGMALAEHGVNVHFDDKHDVCTEVSEVGIVVYHVKSGRNWRDRKEWHAPWNAAVNTLRRGTPGHEGTDVWLIERPFEHPSSEDIAGAYLQFRTDLKTNVFFEKQDLARIKATRGKWAEYHGAGASGI